MASPKGKPAGAPREEQPNGRPAHQALVYLQGHKGNPAGLTKELSPERLRPGWGEVAEAQEVLPLEEGRLGLTLPE